MKHNVVFLLALILGSVLLCTFELVDVNAQTEPAPPDSPIATPPPVAFTAEAALKYVAEQYGVAVTELMVSNGQAMEFPLLGRSYVYHVVSPKWADSKVPTVSLLVDPSTGAVEPNVNAVQRQEDEAYAAKYGKLHPDLYKRLLTSADDELLAVAIWIAPDEHAKTFEELQAEVAARFPEANRALAEGRVAWDVEDPDLSARIYKAYVEAVAAEMTRRVQPVDSWLAKRHYKATTFSGMPVLIATLPVAVVRVLAEQPQVAQLYLSNNQGQLEADVAVATDRVPAVWRQGFTGAGTRIAILEPGRINAAARACLNVIAERLPGQTDSPHKSAVAAMAACNDAALPGVAPGAAILDASIVDYSDSEFLNSLLWSINTQGADVVNMSLGYSSSLSLQLTDRAADYMARAYNKTLVKSSGNYTVTGSNVTSPGKGWNVITVGNIQVFDSDGRDTADWSDDDINRDWTAWATAPDLAQKPELVAPGIHINTIVNTQTGSSMSAPQVAGISALLMQRNGQLRSRPNSVRAILLASAVHNIEDVSTGGEYDGAGTVDAAVADEIAQLHWLQENASIPCNRPCWWDISTTVNDPPLNGEVSRYFYATSGERIRVAIAWFSQAAAGPTYSTDYLLTNYDLRVYAPDGFRVAASESDYNSYELVEFVAAQRGQYRISLYRNDRLDHGEPSNTVGMAWSKQATYLPDVRSYTDTGIGPLAVESGAPDGTSAATLANAAALPAGNYLLFMPDLRRFSNGWRSTIVLRNDGAEPRTARITFFGEDGTDEGQLETLLQPNQSWRLQPPNPFDSGAATVDGDEDLSVSVLHELNSPYTLGAYAGIGQARIGALVPIVRRNMNGWYSSIFVYNPNAQPVAATLTFVPLPNLGSSWSHTYSIGPSRRLYISTSELTELGASFAGSVQISADAPVAVASTQYLGASRMMANSSQELGSPIYAPVLQNNNGGWLSSLALQQPPGLTTSSVSYYTDSTGALCAGENWGNNPQLIDPAPTGNPPACGVMPNAILSGQSIVMAATVNQLQNPASTSGSASAYEAIAQPALAAVVPKVQRGSGWSDGFVIMNTSANNTNVTVRLYNIDGSLNSTPINNQPLSAHQSLTVLNQIPNGFNGSALVTASGPVAVTANFYRSGITSGDVVGSQQAIHR